MKPCFPSCLVSSGISTTSILDWQSHLLSPPTHHVSHHDGGIDGVSKNGKNLGFTVFASFGAYYFSFATTMTPTFDLETAYVNKDEFHDAIAILFLSWSLLFLLFVIIGIRTSLVSLGHFVNSTHRRKTPKNESWEPTYKLLIP